MADGQWDRRAAKRGGATRKTLRASIALSSQRFSRGKRGTEFRLITLLWQL